MPISHSETSAWSFDRISCAPVLRRDLSLDVRVANFQVMELRPVIRKFVYQPGVIVYVSPKGQWWNHNERVATYDEVTPRLFPDQLRRALRS